MISYGENNIFFNFNLWSGKKIYIFIYLLYIYWKADNIF